MWWIKYINKTETPVSFKTSGGYAQWSQNCYHPKNTLKREMNVSCITHKNKKIWSLRDVELLAHSNWEEGCQKWERSGKGTWKD